MFHKQRTATFYFYRVIETVGAQHWGQVNETGSEPIKFEGQPPLGKEPDYCCEGLKKATTWENGNFSWISSHTRGDGRVLAIQSQGNENQDRSINFCPFCGAKIVHQEHLKVRSVQQQETITRGVYRFEVVE